MKKMRSHFTEKQLKIFQAAGYDLSDETDYSDDEICNMEEAVSDYFQLHGLGDNDTVNEIGQTCEGIMDIFGEMG